MLVDAGISFYMIFYVYSVYIMLLDWIKMFILCIWATGYVVWLKMNILLFVETSVISH